MAVEDMAEVSEERATKNLPRRMFLGLSTLGVAAIVAGPSAVDFLSKTAVGSVVSGATGLGGYQIYTVTSGYPSYSPSSYRLSLVGDVNNHLSLSLSDLAQMASPDMHATFHCVTGWTVPNQTFGGVMLKDLLAKAGVSGTIDGKYVNFYSFDGTYTEVMPLSEAMGNTAMVVTHLDGVPLPQEHGAPVRLFVDGSYGYKSIKWLSKIEVSSTPVEGYWEQYGYPANARIA